MGRIKPSRTKNLEGNRAKRPPKTSVTPNPQAPSPPSWLRDEALREWKRIVPELDGLGLIAKMDRALLTAYCLRWSEFVEATRDVSTRGVLVEGRDGGRVKNPSVQIARDALDQVLKAGGRFGLSPLDRERLSPNTPDESELADLLTPARDPNVVDIRDRK